MNFQILTLFPEIISRPARREPAGEKPSEGWPSGVSTLSTFVTSRPGKHANVDDTPYGAGQDGVMRADVIDAAIRGAETKFRKPARKIYLSRVARNESNTHEGTRRSPVPCCCSAAVTKA